MWRQYTYVAMLAAGLAFGCAAYHRNPLTPETVQKVLTPPSGEALQVLAAHIKHPILKPVSFDESKGLSPEEAGVLAVLVNPGLRAARDKRAIAEAELIQARLLPNPQLSYSLEFPTGGDTKGTVNAYGFGLDWDISEIISRAARIDSAKAQRASIHLDIAWQEWQVAEGAKAAVYRLTALRSKVALAKEIDERLAENRDLVRHAVDDHLMTELELTAAVSASDQAHATLLDLQKQAAQQRLDLNYLLGQPPPTQVRLRQDIELPESFVPPSEESLAEGLEKRRLDLIALRRGYDAQEAALRAAILGQFPRVGIGLLHARDTSNIVSTGFGVSISLPIFDRNQGKVGLEKASRQMLFDEYTDRLFTSYSDIAKLHAGILLLDDQIKAAESSVPDFEKLVQGYRALAGSGNADALSYYSAWNSLTQKKLEILSLKLELAEARIALELSAGLYQIESSAPAATPAPAQEKENR